MNAGDGMNYAPRAKPQPVCEGGEFRCAAIGLDHGHINGMCLNLADAGAEIVSVFDPDRTKVDEFREKFPMARVVSSAKEILDDDSIQLVASAAITSERGPLGLEVMDHGKHYFSDKAPFTTPRQFGRRPRQGGSHRIDMGRLLQRTTAE